MVETPYNPEDALPPVDDSEIPNAPVDPEYSDSRAEVALGDTLPELVQVLQNNQRSSELLTARQQLIRLTNENAPRSDIIDAQQRVMLEESKLRSKPRPQAE